MCGQKSHQLSSWQNPLLQKVNIQIVIYSVSASLRKMGGRMGGKIEICVAK